MQWYALYNLYSKLVHAESSRKLDCLRLIIANPANSIASSWTKDKHIVSWLDCHIAVSYVENGTRYKGQTVSRQSDVVNINMQKHIHCWWLLLTSCPHPPLLVWLVHRFRPLPPCITPPPPPLLSFVYFWGNKGSKGVSHRSNTKMTASIQRLSFRSWWQSWNDTSNIRYLRILWIYHSISSWGYRTVWRRTHRS